MKYPFPAHEYTHPKRSTPVHLPHLHASTVLDVLNGDKTMRYIVYRLDGDWGLVRMINVLTGASTYRLLVPETLASQLEEVVKAIVQPTVLFDLSQVVSGYPAGATTHYPVSYTTAVVTDDDGVSSLVGLDGAS